MTRLSALMASAVLAISTLAAACSKDDKEPKGDPAAQKAGPGKAAGATEAAAERERRDRPTMIAKRGDRESPGARATAEPTKAEEAEAQRQLDQLGPKLEAFMNDAIRAVEAAEGNCDELAGPVAKVFNDSADVLAKMKSTDKTQAAATWKREHADLMRHFGSKMPAIFECAQKKPELAEAVKALQ